MVILLYLLLSCHMCSIVCECVFFHTFFSAFIFWLTWFEQIIINRPENGGGGNEVAWDYPGSPQGPKGLQWAAWLYGLKVFRLNQGLRGRNMCWFWQRHPTYVRWSCASLTLCRKQKKQKMFLKMSFSITLKIQNESFQLSWLELRISLVWKTTKIAHIPAHCRTSYEYE